MRSASASRAGRHQRVVRLRRAGGRVARRRRRRGSRRGGRRGARRPRGTASRRGPGVAVVSRPARSGRPGRAAPAAGAVVRRAGGGPRPPPREPKTPRPTVAPSSSDRRVGQHLVPGPALEDLGRQLAERPLGLAGRAVARCRRRPPPAPRRTAPRSGALSASRSLPRACSSPSSSTHPVGRLEVGGHLGPVPRLARDDDAGRRPGPALERVEQRLLAGRDRGQELPGLVGRRDEADPQVLGQAPDQAGDQLLPDARDVPREVVGGDPVEGGDRHVDGEAVVGGAGLEVVADREGQALARCQASGKSSARTSSAVSWVSIAGSKVSRSGRAPPLLLPPLVEVGAADDLGADPGVVEVEQRVLVDDDVAPAGAVLELLGLLEQTLVLPEEAVPAGPLAVHQGVPDEELAAQLAVDPAERRRAGR